MQATKRTFPVLTQYGPTQKPAAGNRTLHTHPRLVVSIGACTFFRVLHSVEFLKLHGGNKDQNARGELFRMTTKSMAQKSSSVSAQDWVSLEKLTGSEIDLSSVRNEKVRKALEKRQTTEAGMGHLDHDNHTDDPT